MVNKQLDHLKTHNDRKVLNHVYRPKLVGRGLNRLINRSLPEAAAVDRMPLKKRLPWHGRLRSSLWAALVHQIANLDIIIYCFLWCFIAPFSSRFRLLIIISMRIHYEFKVKTRSSPSPTFISLYLWMKSRYRSSLMKTDIRDDSDPDGLILQALCQQTQRWRAGKHLELILLIVYLQPIRLQRVYHVTFCKHDVWVWSLCSSAAASFLTDYH